MEKYFSNKDYRMLYYDSFFKTFANSIYAVFKPGILYKAGVSVTMLIFIFIVIYSYYTNNRRKSEISETLQDLTLTVDTAAKTSLINSPFPLVIVETDGNIIWISTKFATEFANIDINNYMSELIDDLREKIEQEQEKNVKRDIRWAWRYHDLWLTRLNHRK